MSRYQLAQLNIATLKAPLDSPQPTEFVANLDSINALAEQSPGLDSSGGCKRTKATPRRYGRSART